MGLIPTANDVLKLTLRRTYDLIMGTVSLSSTPRIKPLTGFDKALAEQRAKREVGLYVIPKQDQNHSR